METEKNQAIPARDNKLESQELDPFADTPNVSATTYTLTSKAEPQHFTTAQEAGAAYFHADPTQRPTVIQGLEGNRARVMAETEIHGKAESGEQLFMKTLPGGNHEGYAEFRAGYFQAKEQAASALKELDPFADDPAPPKAAPDAQSPFDKVGLEQVAAARANDRLEAEKNLGLNAIESAKEVERETALQQANAAKASSQPEASATGNTVESDEIFTATQGDNKAVVPSEVEQLYLRVGDKFYHSKYKDLLAFEDKGNKLETASNSENIAESMVRIAEARGWDEIKVSGSETFRREAWLEAATRGMHVKGYTPTEQDKAELAKRVPANKIEKENETFRVRENNQTAEAEKPAKQDARANSFANESPQEAIKKHPELVGAYAAVAAIDKKAEADGFTDKQRAIIQARVRQNVINSIERGNIPEVKVKEAVQLQQERNSELEQTR
jgi:hypothetical protein